MSFPNPPGQIQRYATAGTQAFASEVVGDTNARYLLTAAGAIQWGSGAAVADVELYRPESNAVALGTDSNESAVTRFLEIRATAAPTVFAATTAAGTDVFFQAQDGGGAGNRGGDINFIPGAGVTTGRAGNVGVSRLRTTGASTANFVEMPNGNGSAVSAANEGRIRYNSTTQTFQVSLNGAAYASLTTGAASFPVLSSGAGTPVILTSASATVTGAGNTIAGGGGTLAATLTSGTNNVLIGSSVDVGTATAANAVAIGNTAVAPSGGVVIGNAAGKAGASGAGVTAVGNTAGGALTTGLNNSFFGSSTGAANTTGNNNTFIGFNSGAACTTSLQNTCVGSQAGANITTTTGLDNNVFIGFQAGQNLTTGGHNVIIGATAGTNAAFSSNNVLIGFASGGSTFTGTTAVIIGASSLTAATTGNNLVAIGQAVALTVGTATNTVVIGTNSTCNASSVAIGSFVNCGMTQSIVIGASAGNANTAPVNNIIIGFSTGGSVNGSGNTIVGVSAGSTLTTGTNNVILGVTANVATSTDASAVAIGHTAVAPSSGIAIGENAGLSGATAARFISIGNTSGHGITTGADNIFIGDHAGAVVSTGASNTIVGSTAGQTMTTGLRNTFFGFATGKVLIAAQAHADNTLVGFNAGVALAGTAAVVTGNTYIGSSCGDVANPTTGGNNTGVGFQCLHTLTTGTGNTAIGKDAGNGTLTTGTGNTLLGSGVTTNAAATANAIVIGTGAGVVQGSSTSIIMSVAARNDATTNMLYIASGDTGLHRTAAGIVAFNTGNGGVGAGAHEFIGAATATFAVAPANNGRIFYDSTLQHFTMSENGGPYTSFSPYLTVTTQSGAGYTVTQADAGGWIQLNNAAAQNLLIPTNASVAFPIGTTINVISIGAGQWTIQAVTPGTTTIQSTGATSTAPALRVTYSSATIVKVATDTWQVVGDII